jgi:ATP-dependent RNA helicase RhlE
MTFEDLKLTRQFLDAITDAGYTTPTEIQEKGIPRILSGQDLIGIAQTGTGKTAAYLLPVLSQLKYAQGEEPRALVLVPTKELVIQVMSEAEKLSKYTDLRCVALYGGIGPMAQAKQLIAGVDLVIATPGRLLEMYSRGAVLTRKIKHIVLDECDRMMDMGFWPQLREVQEKMPQKKQQLLFSATFPPKVERIADNFLLFPSRIEVTPQATPASSVAQLYYRVPNVASKMNLLLYLLQNEAWKRVMVFVSTREMATAIGNYLERKIEGEVRLLHSNKAQNARINAMSDFKSGDVRVLVSTDVSARGIDVFEVSHVVNFTVPNQHEDYVHRIGRTGRAFKTGEAITFVSQHEEYHLRKIETLIRQKVLEAEWPAEVELVSTSRDESIVQLREIDRQKRVEDPDFKGAFHEKKRKQDASRSKSKAGKKRRR